MNEWIDFAVYASQVVLVWALLPRHSAQYAVPAIVDRDPAWPAAHADAIRAIERSRWLVSTFYAWTAIGIGLLILAWLELVPAALMSVDVPGWEMLRRAHGVVMIVGLLGYGACLFVWQRWLTVNVPLSAQRRATLTPRSAGDYLPASWRVVTEFATVGHIAVWLILPALGVGGGSQYWGRFAFVAVMTAGLSAYAYLAPHRRAGYLDRLFGDAYRRAELRVVCLMRLALLTTGAVGMGAAFDVDLAREAHLALQVMISGMALAFLRLRPAGPSDASRSRSAGFAGEPESAA